MYTLYNCLNFKYLNKKMKRNALAEIQSEMSKSSSCVNIIVNNHFNQAVPTSWDYGSFNPSSNYYSRTNLHNKENILNFNNQSVPWDLPRSPDLKPSNGKDAKYDYFE